MKMRFHKLPFPMILPRIKSVKPIGSFVNSIRKPYERNRITNSYYESKSERVDSRKKP